MRRYEKYINNDLKILGEIPAHWKVLRFKNITTKIQDGTHFTPNYTDNGINFLSVNDITRKNFDLNSSKFISIEEHRELIKRCRPVKGDILLSKNGTIGVPFLINFDTEISIYVSLCLIRLKKEVYNKYFLYLLQSSFMFEQYKINAKTNSVSNLHLDKLANFYSVIAPLIEQQAIANYLDAKTQAIDKKVSLLEQKIETYKKLKNTIIAKVVTQGISNQELSINDLGFKTPANWTKYRLKDLGKLFSGLSGKSGDDFNQEDNPNNRGFIPFTNIANNTYLKKDHLGTVVINPGEKQNKVRKGDLFFLMSSEGYGDIGKTAVLADDIDEAYLNSFCKGYRVNQNKCNPYFLNYLLLSNIYRQRLIVEGKGFTRINLKMEKVTDFEIFLPPTLSEQEEVATYIDHKTATIDAIVGNISKQIDTLKQLRKTLINDVVTGKIKVVE